ncbi:bifunctional 3-demethylubiquinone 3-O-methyltransferase/2-octaprenyl-6-hydroxy phenol methylase, partial [Micromonospora provocatoris]
LRGGADRPDRTEPRIVPTRSTAVLYQGWGRRGG